MDSGDRNNLSNWIIEELTNKLGSEFNSDELVARYGSFKIQNNEYYNFLITPINRRVGDPLKIYMSLESLMDSIDFSNRKSISYDADKLNNLLDQIEILLSQTGIFKLLMYNNNEYSFEKIV